MRRDCCLAGLLLASCVLTAHAAERTPSKPAGKTATPVPAPNLEFLEYLGTLESDEDNWTDVVNVELPSETKSKSDESKTKPKAEAAAKNASSKQ